MKKLALLFVSAIIIQTSVLSQGCLPDGITFTSQEEIDNFQTNYPNCTEIEGEAEIKGDDITNLDGLNVLTSFGNDLEIRMNPSLTSLMGLDNVTTIGRDLMIEENATLTSLSGLDNVTSIGHRLYIEANPALTSLTELNNLTSIDDMLHIWNNDALTSLTGLDNVISVGGEFWIWENATLASLTGLDNIDAGSITSLYISNNPLLSICEVQSICDYLANPNGLIEINDNATGCNSQEEVETACEAIGVVELIPDSKFTIFPNPATDKLFITSSIGLKIEAIIIYNQLGQKVLDMNKIKDNIDISILGQGIYIIELTSSKMKIRQKLVIEE